MRWIALLFLVLITLVKADDNQDSLYTISTKAMGIQGLDLTIKEIERKDRISIVEVVDFHKRSAAESRWLMCAYTALAIRRGFKYWAVVYPEGSKGELIVGFPETLTEDFSQTLDPAFSRQYLGPAVVEALTKLCGIAPFAKSYSKTK